MKMKLLGPVNTLASQFWNSSLRSHCLFASCATTRHLSAFSGRIPVDAVTSSVTFIGDRCLPRVEMRFKVDEAYWLDEELRTRLAKRYEHRISSSGELVVESCRTRSKQLNLADCFDKIRSAIYDLEACESNEEVCDEREMAIENARKKLRSFRDS